MEIVYPDLSTTEFEYDGYGRRVRLHEKNSSGGTVLNRTFLWDGLGIAEERDSTGSTVAKRHYDLGVRVGSTNYFYTKDHLGSIREVTDSAGALAARYDYDPYGRVTQTAGTFESDFLFTGHFHHAKSSLHLAPYRAYDADLGRWLSRDPLDWAELLPEGPNLYGYVAGNPVNWWDRLGLAQSSPQYELPGETPREPRSPRDSECWNNVIDWLKTMGDAIIGFPAFGGTDAAKGVACDVVIPVRKRERIYDLLDDPDAKLEDFEEIEGH